MKTFEFRLKVSKEAWLEYYRKPNSTVVARTLTGQRIQFGAKHLVKHVGHDGIDGLFVLTMNANNDFVSLERAR